MTSPEFRDLIKTLKTKFSKYYAGKLDNKYQKSICIYAKPSFNHQDIAIGGKEATKTKTFSFDILVHGTQNYTETENLSSSLYEDLVEVTENLKHESLLITPMTNCPVDLHTDENGVYERLIEIKLYETQMGGK